MFFSHILILVYTLQVILYSGVLICFQKYIYICTYLLICLNIHQIHTSKRIYIFLSDYDYLQSFILKHFHFRQNELFITKSHTLGCRFLQPPYPDILFPYTSYHTIHSIAFVTIESLSISDYIHKHIDANPY